MKLRKKGLSRLATLGIILLSFLILIIVGAVLLVCPFAHNEGQSVTFVDAFFISTSAVCVTGLTPIADISSTFNLFGRIVLAFLIEIGGLGLVSLVMFIAIIFGYKISFGQRLIIKEALNQDAVGGIVSLLKKIVLTAIIIQLCGALMNFISFFFIHDYNFIESIGFAIFHSISSFNNAGFDLFGATSLMNFSGDILLNISTMLMIILGGIGFIVIFDILQKRGNFRKLSLHSKIVLSTTAVLLIGGTLIFKCLNWNEITWLEAMFLSVSSRTAGFYSFDLRTLSHASLLITLFLMFFGAAPASTGGGVKVTTLFTILSAFKAFATGKNEHHAFKRTIGYQNVVKAFILSIFALLIIVVSSFFIFIIEGEMFEFDEVLFETVSSFATVGLTTGITTNLQSLSKIVLCIVMYVGRLGPITFISLFNRNINNINKDEVRFVEENVIIG